MPLIRIESNQCLGPEAEKTLAKDLSTLAAGLLDKPESYVMIHLHLGQTMAFAGSDAALANVEVKSIGLQTAQAANLSKVLCEFLEERLGVDPARVYIQFSAVPGALWGWNGATF
jgi:phenylpyruvate tautomerase PptA (4-oxalocrotonate tautomerase family)